MQSSLQPSRCLHARPLRGSICDYRWTGSGGMDLVSLVGILQNMVACMMQRKLEISIRLWKCPLYM